jgi:hypothetical protein
MVAQVKANLAAGHSGRGKPKSLPSFPPAPELTAAPASAAQAGSDDLMLPDVIADQREFDELVAGWFAELDLEGSSDAATEGPSTSAVGVATTALLSEIFISALPVLSETNVQTM